MFVSGVENIYWLLAPAIPFEAEISKAKYVQVVESIPELVWQDDVWPYWPLIIAENGPEWANINAWVMAPGMNETNKISFSFDQILKTKINVWIECGNVDILFFDESAIELIFTVAEKMNCRVFEFHSSAELSKAAAYQKLDAFRSKYAKYL